MRIATFSDGKHTSAIPHRAPTAADQKNWLTVLIGKNGSRKSLLLRLLLEAALGHATIGTGSRYSIRPQLTMWHPSSQISAAIAIAGTPFDRFPRQTRYQRPAQPSKYDLEEKYFYLGMKAANGTMGSAQGVRTIATLLFHTLVSGQQLSGSINRVFDFLSFKHELGVIVRRHTSINFARNELKGKGQRKLGQLSPQKLVTSLKRVKESSDDLDLVRWAQTLLDSPAKFDELGARLGAFPAPFYIAFSRSTVAMHDEHWKPDELLRLFKAGLLVPSHLAFQKIGDDEWLFDSELSSGQWHLMSSMLGLALTLQRDALVLIDEPENSLHPEWQRVYAELLSDVIQRASGCHVFIATHSPLIASGVKPGAGDVLRMEVSEGSALDVDLCLVENTYGWDVDDVYRQVFEMDSARATSFIESVDEALELIAEGDKSSTRLKFLAKQFVSIVETLPQPDPMRTILSSIIGIASRQGNAK
jgi:hypothetical protein